MYPVMVVHIYVLVPVNVIHHIPVLTVNGPRSALPGVQLFPPPLNHLSAVADDRPGLFKGFAAFYPRLPALLTCKPDVLPAFTGGPDVLSAFTQRTRE
jgi:hypothetical protein